MGADRGDESVDGGGGGRPGSGNPRAGRRPAFQLYPADFLADEKVALMTTTQVGAYSLLLFFHWREGSIPADPADLARLARMKTGAAWRTVWRRLEPCFMPHPSRPDRLVQKRMFEALESGVDLSRSRSESGARGGRKSAQVRRAAQASASTLPQQIQALQSSSSSPSPLSLELVPKDGEQPQLELSGERVARGRWLDEFRVLWERHPGRPDGAGKARKRGRALAEAAYLRLRPDLELAKRILSGHASACAGRQWIEGYVPDLFRWLRGRGWEDELVEGAAGETQQERWAREQREGSKRWLEARAREREGGAA